MNSISHTKAFEMPIPIAELFPLFSPEGEAQWVPGWAYENVMGTTDLSEDYVFLTQTHDHGTTDAIWIVKKYDPSAHFVQFYKVEPKDKVGVITVKCLELEADRTEVQVTYNYIAISLVGQKFISEFTEAAYDAFIGEWQTLLTRHFEAKG